MKEQNIGTLTMPGLAVPLGKSARAAAVAVSVAILMATAMAGPGFKRLMKSTNMSVIGYYNLESKSGNGLSLLKDHRRWYLLIHGSIPNDDKLVDVTKPSNPTLAEYPAGMPNERTRLSQDGDQTTAYLRQGYTPFRLKAGEDGLHAFDVTDQNRPIEVASAIPLQQAQGPGASDADTGSVAVDGRANVYFKDRYGRLWILRLNVLTDDQAGGS